jgi:hypothetical protein
MRYMALFSLMLLISCNKPLDADTIIDRSIAAHGGWETYENLDIVKYRKQYDLFLEDGTLERSLDQRHTTHINPVYKNEIVRTDGSVLSFDGSVIIKTMGDSTMQTTSGDTGLIHSSFYVLAQPFKLKDPGATLTYEGLDTLFNGKSVEVVKVEYKEEGKENHPWWYYFDPSDYKLVGNMVDHNGSFSLITNDEYVEYKGILWNVKRTGYRTTPEGEILFKRSDYVYEYYP